MPLNTLQTFPFSIPGFNFAFKPHILLGFVGISLAASSMASASFAKICLHCEENSSDPLKNGWDLSTGKFAQLCHRCYSIYESGHFCETFHRKQHDWRNCQLCNKPVHCSCLVSFSGWFYLEGGWDKVICKECSKVTSFMAQNFSNVMDLAAEGIKKLHICRLPKSTIAPMFEKLLTAGDVDNSDGSIVIPKKYAEIYLPEVSSDPNGITLLLVSIIDNKEWKMRFRFWLQKMYILDDLREFIALNNLQGGDTLTFSRLVPNGKYFIGFKKALTKKPLRKAFSGRVKK